MENVGHGGDRKNSAAEENMGGPFEVLKTKI
jgi:hypothetical protein